MRILCLKSSYVNKAVEKLRPYKKSLFIVGGLFLLAITLTVIFYERLPWDIKVDGRAVAAVADKKIAQSALKEVVLSHSQASGRQVSPAARISFRRTLKGNNLVTSIDSLKEILEREIKFQTEAVALVVNGEKKIILPDQDTAEALMEKVKSQYIKNTGDQIAFAEDIKLEDTVAQTDQILTLEEALTAVKGEYMGVNKYTVKEGDTLWDIAEIAHQDIDSIQKINPGFAPERLQIGQVINLFMPVPLINVVTVSRPVVKEEIPFAVEEKSDENLLRNQYKVIQRGIPGLKETAYEITYRNGIEVSRQVLNEEVLEAPTAQIVSKGTRWLLASRSGGSGRLARPVNGVIISPFGQRGREFHAGIDMTASSGTPVKAAESGTVAYAGWYGGYGRYVQISHGNGIATCYAHLSSINVREGQQIDRGQVLGLVGSTGHASGPHLHFEVRNNGQAINPAQFL